MRIVGNAQLVWYGQQQGVCLRDRLILPKLLDENIRLSSIAAAKDRPRAFVQEADLVLFLAASSKIGAIAVVDQCKDTAANRNARSACVASFLPACAKGANLRS